MLRSLYVRDMLIIDRLELEFQVGLNVLTGETGAGKSILLDALGFVLGWRGRAALVRAGATQGEVVAVFELPPDHAARTILQDAGLPVADELILRRTNALDGRKTAWVNDRRASGETLRALSDCLVELHGQQDDRGLLNASSHRKLLDDFGALDGDVQACLAAWRALEAAGISLSEAEQTLAAARKEEDFVRHAVAELARLAAQPGEEASLDARRRMMQAAERIGDDIAKAEAALGVQGAEKSLADASRWLEDVADKAAGRLAAPLAALGRAMEELGIAQQGVADCIHELASDPDELEQAEERLFEIRALARKHDVQPDALDNFLVGMRQRLAALDAGDADLAARRQALDDAQSKYDRQADRLGQKRRKAATRLDRAMARELTPLKLDRARFTTQIAPRDPGAAGQDAVTFCIAPNPGTPSGPLNKIASGGELSRLLLALKVCLSGGASGLTLIFDEIDRGLGGATADAVGRRLAELAKGAQVLIVTHSPQVAARGQHHWRVEKQVTKTAALSIVTALDAPARIDEVARMLAGDKVTNEARAAAKALLDG
jgi:DNA repair protein RecN (Recombination protein N)